MRTLNPRILLFVAVISVFGLDWAFAAPPLNRDEDQMDAWWADLAKSEPEASRALLNFDSQQKESTAYIKRKLRPLTVDADIIGALLTKLGSSKESEWKPAFEELEYFDPRLAIDLPTLMDQVKQSPARQRLVEILSNFPAELLKGKSIDMKKLGPNYYFFLGRGDWPVESDVSKLNSQPFPLGDGKPQWTRAIRAIVLLAHINTPAAIAVIKDMATGNPNAQPTKVAQDAIARLANENTVYNSPR